MAADSETAETGGDRMRRSGRALALLATFLVIVAVSAAWIVNLRMGPPLEGLAAGATVLFVPMVIVVLTAGWLIVRGVLHGRVRWRAVTVLAVAVAVSFALIAVNCGPVACFRAGPPNYLAGWFTLVGVPLAALVHHVVLVSFPLVPSDGR